MGLWAVCVPHDAGQAVFAALRNEGIQCVVTESHSMTAATTVVCSDGDAIVHLRIRTTPVTLEMAGIRASVEHALCINLGRVDDRGWRERGRDRVLFSRIKAVLAPFTDVEDEIEKAALLAATANPAETAAVLREWNRRYGRRGGRR
jgi:hypothetical protein